MRRESHPFSKIDSARELNTGTIAAFDFQLRKRMRQRGAHIRDFLVREFLRQAFLGTFAGLFRFGLVNVRGFDRHIGQDRHARASDLDETLTRLQTTGAKLVEEVVRYENAYRLCYIRGPENLLIGLAEEL